ncbi:MAG: adenylate kinase [Candidatus Magasanikbacteria bacterium CG_4_10_14_0_2_um_filter_33_14]|uniref:Adenylate kinase n=1 Tax=Candidatus Magasanikbacteria bacterium CG_4_10_14_0_2_um_filter_33_14 TaxID=1974636 RepID=A0A2M7V9Q0_9BACT|nr:MAG: adenylate kinase [Candidatus Magasanikbacteria bacterium CG_4_10_14_0_2_um_filter_33_14]
MKRIIILMGVPGSGKGTQARKLVQKFDFAHISTGDLLRALDADPNGDKDDKAKLAEMKAGKLVSDDLIYKLAFTEIKKNLDAGKNVILDGAIRTVEQAKKYEDFFSSIGMSEEVIVIEISLSDETSYNRLTKRKVCPTCGFILPYSPENEMKTDCPECSEKLIIRSDDNPETIQKRIKEQGNVALQPILEYYREKGELFSVDGERDIETVDVKVVKLLS